MTTPEDVDGAAWRVELERWHAELANTIYQASLWAREFHVPTGDGRWGDASAPPSYPLLGYAERLETIGATLKMVCANASLDPPALSWDRTTLKAPPMMRVPGRDPDWRDADYFEGGRYSLHPAKRFYFRYRYRATALARRARIRRTVGARKPSGDTAARRVRGAGPGTVRHRP